MELVSATPVLVILVLAASTLITTAGTSTTSTTSAPELLVKDAVMIEYPASTLVAFSSAYENLPNGTYSFAVPLPSIFGYTPQVAMCTSRNGSWYRYFFLYNQTQHYLNNTTVNLGYFGGYTTYINGTLKDHILNATAPTYIYIPPPSCSVTIYPDCAVSLQPPIIKTETMTSTQTKTETQTTTMTTTQTSIETTTATSTETTTATTTQTTTQTSMVAVPYIPLWFVVLIAALAGIAAFSVFASIYERRKNRVLQYEE